MFASDTVVDLRPLHARDLGAFQAYRSDPDIARFQDWEAMSDDQARGFLTAMSHVTAPRTGDWVQIGISRSGVPGLLGDLGVFLSACGQSAEIGITLSAGAQGQGFATRAYRLACSWVFETSDAHVIEGIADARNLKSLRMFDRLGMERTRTLPPDPDRPGLVEYVHLARRPRDG